MKSNKKLKLKKNIKIYLFLIIVLLFILFLLFSGKGAKTYILNKSNMEREKKEAQRREIYNKCITEKLPEESFSDDLISKKEAIVKTAKNGGANYYYEDLKNGYTIFYDKDEAMYGASLIKLVTALYILDNDIDLNKELVYKAKFKSSSSLGMENHKIGEKIPLKKVLEYSISVSDNTAHHMIIDFIGKSNLKKYANSIGAKHIFTGLSDDYGNQSVGDTSIYLKKMYELINEKDSAKFMLDAMYNKRRNALSTDTFQIAHKYGSYNAYFHDIGIFFGEHDYSISVMTTKGVTNGTKFINNLSVLTNEFNNSYYDELDKYCKNYSNEKTKIN